MTYLRLKEQGVGAEEAGRLFAPVSLETRVVGDGPADQETASESWALTYVLVLLLYATVILYGTYLATGVIEEKSTRVVEILISTVRPFHLMLGKVLGLGAVALFQYALWVGTGFVLLLAAGSQESLELGPLTLEFSQVDPWMLLAFLVFFVLGFFSYAGLFAAGGSLVSRTEDAQQVTGPLSFVVVIVFFVSMYALDNPDGPVAVAFSLIPVLSPIVMFVRVAVGEPPLWQVLLSVGLSGLAILALIALAAKVFRAGVLMYGKGISLRSLRAALR
jgi:ABC-2 type transport system permease protein